MIVAIYAEEYSIIETFAFKNLNAKLNTYECMNICLLFTFSFEDDRKCLSHCAKPWPNL